MPLDVRKLLEQQRKLIEAEKLRLGSEDHQQDVKQSKHENDDFSKIDCDLESDDRESKKILKEKNAAICAERAELVEPLDLFDLEQEKESFIAKIASCENPLTVRLNDRPESTMFRYGEYSPNNPNFRASAAPFLGLGEYEERRKVIQQQRKNDYREYINKVQYELHSQDPAERELSPQAVFSDKENYIMNSNHSSFLDRIDQKLNSIYGTAMEKPRSILTNRRTESPRERLMQDLKHSYVPSFMDGFNYQDKTEELQRERLKRELYQQELKMQIEEKRRLALMREEQERREQQLENRRLEQQLLRMQEEQIRDDHRRNTRDEQMRRNSEEFIRRKQELQSRGYRKHTESESGLSSLRNTTVASKPLSHYSPPVSRRNPYSFNIPSSSVFADPSTRYNPSRYDFMSRKDTLNRMDSLNPRETSRQNPFSRYDSLSRIDTLNRQEALNRLESLNIKDSLNRVQRRHSATQQDLSTLRRSPKAQRRNSSGRFDDTLPIPVLKAHSPVAKELKNSVAVSSSRHSSDAVRRLEDKWQVPAVQKNIVNHGDLLSERHGRSILTQLGAIRMQLQQEQLRMDETLRKRGISQSKAVDTH